MSKLITKFKYLKPGTSKVGGYAKYIATREGVDRIDESLKSATATKRQQQLIEKILHDFPDAKNMLEFEDYQRECSVGTASEFISRAIEDNAHEALNRKTYADYIATRPRAERQGSHGLFTDDGVPLQLSKVSESLNTYDGNVWTIILSLRREDAERLGFNVGERWRDMLRTQTQALAENFKIPVENLRWYAAFHNESHHPHVHMIVYSVMKNEGYLSGQGIHNLRASFMKDIFAQELLCTYEEQTEQRTELRTYSKQRVAEIVSRMNQGCSENMRIERKLLELADRLANTTGKKQYGYLKTDTKAIVNTIVQELASDERIAELYDLWYQNKERTIRMYTDTVPDRVELVDNPEFRSIKNAVIQEAMKLALRRQEYASGPQTSSCVPRLLQLLCRMLCNGTAHKQENPENGVVDRKLRRKTDKKKQAQGLKH